MFRIQLLTTLLLLGATGFAAAADPGVPMENPPAGYDWSGVYVGIQAGYGWGSNDYRYEDDRVDFEPDGFLGGLTVGANWQSGSFVYGVEADISYSDVEGSVLSDDAAPCYVEGCTANIDWFATGRARLGYAVDNFLPYVTGGFAVGRVEGSADLGACGFPAFCAFDKTEIGWTAGFGIEWGLTQKLSLKAEYLHIDFGSPGFNNGSGGEARVDEIALDTVRLGLNYRF